MENQILLKERDWGILKGKLCLVTEFAPLAEFVDGQVKALDVTLPYAQVTQLTGWMALVGAIDRAEHFRIGRQCNYQPQQDGEFSCYANDAWFKYGNNRGRLTVSVQRIA